MSDPSQETHDPLLGRAMGRFTIRARLGTGAIGSVYRADDARTGTPVALKVLHPDVARNANAIKRLEREAAFAQRIVHPNVVRVMEVGTHEGLPFVAMELIAGQSLDEVVAREGALTPDRAGRVALGIVSALVEAHAQGIVHRDLKPANVMLEGQGAREQAKLVDFGVARIVDDDDSAAPLTRLTREGFTVGTPAYMAPEQFSSAEVGPEADLYAVGLILHEMLAGQPAFAGNLREVIVKQMTELPPALPPYEGLGPLVARLTVKEQADRPARAVDVQAELRAIVRAMQRTKVVGVEDTTVDARAPSPSVDPSPTSSVEGTFFTAVGASPATRESQVVRKPVERRGWWAVIVLAVVVVVGVVLWGAREGGVVRSSARDVPVASASPSASAVPAPVVGASSDVSGSPLASASPSPVSSASPSPVSSASPSPVSSASPSPLAEPPPARATASRAAARAPRPSRASAPVRASDPARRRAPDPCRSAVIADDHGKLCFDHIDTTLRAKTLEPGHRLWKRYSDLWLRTQYPQTEQEQAASMSALRALAREVDRLP